MSEPMEEVSGAALPAVEFEVSDVSQTLEHGVALSQPENWRHLMITVTLAQRKAFDAGAAKEGVSQRAYAQAILAAWLRKPTLVQPVTAAPKRVKIRVNISSKVYDRLSAYAQDNHITMTAVGYTAIARHFDL